MKNAIGPQILSMFVFALFVGSKYDIWFIVIHAIYNGECKHNGYVNPFENGLMIIPQLTGISSNFIQ